MNKFSVLVRGLLVFGCLVDGGARAADLSGVWASSADVCNKVFTKRGSNISFAKDSEIHGSGFIIEGNRIRGKIARCAIKSTKEEGMTVHMIASCATDIMLSNVQLSVRIVDQNNTHISGYARIGIAL